ncbi:MAG: sigma-70 family RNA polymerase sigma factor [Gemmataceae bacterium]|nr:sigma-70 family RNA polymerase sigma factor [Gemmataceae bacterium]
MSPGHSTSLSLLDRVRANDPTAWQRLVYLYTPLVVYWCRNWGVDGVDAEDIAQDVFHGVSAGLAKFRHDRTGDTFRGWLRGITRNKLLDHFRRRDHQPQAQGGSDAQRRLSQVAETDQAEDSDEQLSGLYHRALELVRGEFEVRTWQAFWRCAVEGHAPADVAADLGVTAAAVRMAKSRVLRRLREEVGDVID